MTATPRRGPLHVGSPKAPDCDKGTCRWCGEAIVLVEPTDYRRARRRYHYGDEHEVGDTDCLSRWKASVCWDARGAVKLRDTEAHGHLFCADCGQVVGAEKTPDGRWNEVAWEADHRIPLEDGGPHHIDNLQALCVPCHRKKSATEATRRAERRRFGPSVAPAPSTQQQLAAT